jgi:hypothetical protein
VEKGILEIIKNNDGVDNFFLHIIKKDEKKYEVFVVVDNLKNNFESIDEYSYVKKSNRKVLIDNVFYPLTFHSDFVLGTDFGKTKLISLRERDEIDKEYGGFKIYRNYVIFEGPSIIFDNKGRIYDKDGNIVNGNDTE